MGLLDKILGRNKPSQPTSEPFDADNSPHAAPEPQQFYEAILPSEAEKKKTTDDGKCWYCQRPISLCLCLGCGCAATDLMKARLHNELDDGDWTGVYVDDDGHVVKDKTGQVVLSGDYIDVFRMRNRLREEGRLPPRTTPILTFPSEDAPADVYVRVPEEPVLGIKYLPKKNAQGETMCPKCGSAEFYTGPEAGIGANVKCCHCGAWFVWGGLAAFGLQEILGKKAQELSEMYAPFIAPVIDPNKKMDEKLK